VVGEEKDVRSGGRLLKRLEERVARFPGHPKRVADYSNLAPPFKGLVRKGFLEFPHVADGDRGSRGGKEVEVRVGGLPIRPGDVLHADANGVTSIPRDLVPEVALACQKFMDAEALILDYAKAGTPTVDGLRQAQDACFQRFAAIPEEVRGARKR